jgi:nitroreductase
MTSFDELTMRRRSVREYDATQKVTREEIEQMVKAALEAPTWKNSETGRYHVVMADSTMMAGLLACLPDRNQERVNGCGALIVTTFVKNRSGFHRVDDTTDEQGNPLSEPDNELGNGWGCYDLGLQSAYLLLKAADLGLDTLVLGLRDADQIRQHLSIADNETVVAVIAVGHRKSEPQRPRRKEVSDVANFQ